MKKKTFLFVFSLFAISLCAEEMPAGYYDNANGKKDAELKTALHEIIKDGDRLEYGPNTYHSTNDKNGRWKAGDLKAIGTWGGFLTTDSHSDGSIWDMYGPHTRYFPPKGRAAAGLDIEHGLPKSWWGFKTNKTNNNTHRDSIAFRDLYHLTPADMYANMRKSNLPPGVVDSVVIFNNDIFKIGSSKGKSFKVFEPADCYKGDFARAYFYIATAYQDLTWAAETADYLDPTDYQLFKTWLRDILLEWHRLDPVGDKELRRIDAVSSIQHNRNPFIDYPELVEYIWGNKQGEEANFAELTYTGDEQYICSPETDNPTAYIPTDITEQGFTASWNDTDSPDYSLEVFHLQESGSNDTLLNVPLVCADSIKANTHLTWQNVNGTSSTFNFTDGGGALFMCATTGNVRKSIIIKDLTIGSNTRLIVKCSIYNKGDSEAALVVLTDNDTLITQPLTLDEKFYSYTLPSGTKEIILTQKGNATNRVSMQQIFIVQGDYKREEVMVDGYPKTITTTSYHVETPMPLDETVYYRVTPQGLRTSNTVSVCRSSNPSTDTPEIMLQPQEKQPQAQKILQNGTLYLLMPDGKRYSATGQRL